MRNGVKYSREDLMAIYLKNATEMENRGERPSGRKLIALARGGTPQDYPNGISGNDRIAYDAAMTALGYSLDAKSGRWTKSIPGLDEVECIEVACPMHATDYGNVHTLADHA